MKPWKLLLFLTACLSAFLLLGFVFPDGIRIGSLELKFFRLPGDETGTGPASENRIDKSALLQLQKKAEILAAEDTLISGGKQIQEDDASGILGPDVEFHIDSASALQYPAGDSTILDAVFQRMDSARLRGELVRILHIGDSQIEGDRISGYLRQRLQQRFGGCGPGLIPISEELPSRLYLRMDGFEQTEKFQLLGSGKKGRHNSYSLLHHYFHLKPDSDGSARAEFRYRLNQQGYRRNAYFEQALLLSKNTDAKLSISSGLGNRRYLASDSLRFIGWKSNRPEKEFSLSISTGTGTDLLGLCLDCRSGVALDNIPLRGSSGLELLKINPAFLQEQVRRLNTRLIILQFGVNVVPYEAPSYTWYENNLVKIISLLKKSAPGIQVLVVGVSDMARKKNGNWGSFETIPAVIEAQRRACARTNAAFWDMYQVMGGKNAILAWSKTNPPLAGKDMIHLTPKGAQVVGEFLYQAIQREIPSP